MRTALTGLFIMLARRGEHAEEVALIGGGAFVLILIALGIGMAALYALAWLIQFIKAVWRAV